MKKHNGKWKSARIDVQLDKMACVYQRQFVEYQRAQLVYQRQFVDYQREITIYQRNAKFIPINVK